ncbi:MAG: hypothetical protein ACM31C_13955 [Acidobacteriota bacterium]
MSAARLLDAMHSLAAIEALEPARYAEVLAGELPAQATLAELEAADRALAAALAHVDATCARVMRIRLDHALATDSSIEAPTRKVFAHTVVHYARDLALLETRARDVAARGRARDPAGVAALVVEAARATLAQREALRAGILALVRDRATAAAPVADARARDRDLDERERKQWSAARRDLEALAAEPETIARAPRSARLAALPEQLDDPAPAPEPTLAELLELD